MLYNSISLYLYLLSKLAHQYQMAVPRDRLSELVGNGILMPGPGVGDAFLSQLSSQDIQNLRLSSSLLNNVFGGYTVMPTNPTQVPHNNVLCKVRTPCAGPQLSPLGPMYFVICNSRGKGIVFRNCEKAWVWPEAQGANQPERVPAHQVGTDPNTWNRILCEPCRDLVAVQVAGHEHLSMRRAKVALCKSCQSYEESRAGGQAVNTCTCAATFAAQWKCYPCRVRNSILYTRSCSRELDFNRHVYRNQTGQIVFNASRRPRNDAINSPCRCGRMGRWNGLIHIPGNPRFCVICKGLQIAATRRRMSPRLRLRPPIDFTPRR